MKIVLIERSSIQIMDSLKNNLYENSSRYSLPDLPKVECVYSLLSMLGSHSSHDVSKKFLELSENPETCVALRQAGCIPYLVQLQFSDSDVDVKKRSSAALYNVVSCCVDDRNGRREIRVLKLIEQLTNYSEILRAKEISDLGVNFAIEEHPIQAIGTLMKISFDEEHRQAMCLFGAIQAISTIVQLDHETHGIDSKHQHCLTLRRYAGMTLTNLTFGDGHNKAILCENQIFMRYLVAQIRSDSDELVQVTASVIRNLSWRADTKIKEVLSSLNTITTLTRAAMICSNENTLKAIISALWNLTNSPQSKEIFCNCNGAIDFIIDMLKYDSPNKTLTIIENAGGVLRNISSLIAIRTDYREILRKKHCLLTLLDQLKSTSLTIVSNATGTIGNLSAYCEADQKILIDNGAIVMLKSLVSSKHKLISAGSSQALRNLLSVRKMDQTINRINGIHQSSSHIFKNSPSLNIRKQKTLHTDVDMNFPKKQLSICDKKTRKPVFLYEKIESDLIESETDSSVIFSPEYQETNIDQLTDFSKKYAENVNETDDSRKLHVESEEDQLKVFVTEGTPRLSSNFGSMTDLRIIACKENKKIYKKQVDEHTGGQLTNIVRLSKTQEIDCSTPERPINYCEEGTPGGFSRSDSFGESDNVSKINKSQETPVENLVEETPLMFSRTSSHLSLSSSWPNINSTDKSSVVSEFSQTSSGLISPSEIPESPLQLVAHPAIKTPPNKTDVVLEDLNTFDDQLNHFCVEDTPARSSRSSLSNLSFEDEPEHLSIETCKSLNTKHSPTNSLKLLNNICDMNSDNDEDGNDDDNLLENTVNIGMQRVLNSMSANDKHLSVANQDADLLESVILDGIQVMTQKVRIPQRTEFFYPTHPENSSSRNFPDQSNTTTINFDFKTKLESQYFTNSSINYLNDMNQSLSSVESYNSLDNSTLLDQLVQKGIDEITKDQDLTEDTSKTKDIICSSPKSTNLTKTIKKDETVRSNLITNKNHKLAIKQNGNQNVFKDKSVDTLQKNMSILEIAIENGKKQLSAPKKIESKFSMKKPDMCQKKYASPYHSNDTLANNNHLKSSHLGKQRMMTLTSKNDNQSSNSKQNLTTKFSSNNKTNDLLEKTNLYKKVSTFDHQQDSFEKNNLMYSENANTSKIKPVCHVKKPVTSQSNLKKVIANDLTSRYSKKAIPNQSKNTPVKLKSKSYTCNSVKLAAKTNSINTKEIQKTQVHQHKLERQNTFTMEEGTTMHIPVVVSSPTRKLKATSNAKFASVKKN